MKQSKFRSGMPMLEMILILGIFSIISIFILQLFLAANTLQRRSKDLSNAIIKTQSIVEVVKGFDLTSEAMEYLNLLKVEETKTQSIYEAYYNRSWEQVDKKENSDYIIQVFLKHIILNSGIKTEIKTIVSQKREYSFRNKEEEQIYNLSTTVFKVRKEV